MDITQRKASFVELGNIITLFLSNSNSSDLYVQELREGILKTYQENRWFTETNSKNALSGISQFLNADKLDQWVNSFSSKTITQPKKIGLIMAGNIPLVGFHDFLSVLISGHKVVMKLSSDDKVLLPLLASLLIKIEPHFKNYIQFVPNTISHIDAIIATGSNNSARYFEYYFGKYPNIIRKNRNSVAILNGSESKEELSLLGKDIFSYFGLGCRNVSKLFIPENYELDTFFEGIVHHGEIINHDKYNNNYTYNKTVYLMNNVPLLDNNFIVLKEDQGMSSPIGVLFYERYKTETRLNDRLKMDKNNIQCVVSKDHVPFGKSQQPELDDYADGINTIDFLINL